MPIIPAPMEIDTTSANPVSLKLPLAINLNGVDSMSREMIKSEMESISALRSHQHQHGAEIVFRTDTLPPGEG